MKFRKREIAKSILTRTALGFVTICLYATPASAVDDVVKGATGAEGGKELINSALKMSRSKPAMSIATTVVCLTCIPVAGVAVSPGMCIACGILIAKTLG